MATARGCYMGTDSGPAFEALPETAQTQVKAFAAFLRHHPSRSICDCGVPLQLMAGRLQAQPSPTCDCPCHTAGYVSSSPAQPPRASQALKA
jgi:hypothetical protein